MFPLFDPTTIVATNDKLAIRDNYPERLQVGRAVDIGGLSRARLSPAGAAYAGPYPAS